MIREANINDFDTIVALNLESEHYLSPMDRLRLNQLHTQAAYHRVIEWQSHVVAFLLVLREGTDYDSANYQWFAARYDTFLYIDRIVVAGAHRGRRLAAALYDDLFAFARANGFEHITCEYDVYPPNQASRRFHARFGFEEVGAQWVADGKKRVSLQRASSGGDPT